MNTQEYYEHVRTWFTKPDAKFGYDSLTHSCVYRHPDDPNCRCAVGCAIPDDEYRTDFEDSTVGALIAEGNLPSLRTVDPKFMGRVQRRHDRYARDTESYNYDECMASFIKQLDELALEYNLEVVK